jgi:hypothetical protein
VFKVTNMKGIKQILKKNTLKLSLVTMLILFAITLVGTVQAANPTLTVIVRDQYTGNPIKGASVKIYNSTYNLVDQGTTLANGTAIFSVDPNHYYYIIASQSEYNDKWTSEWVFTSNETVYIYLNRVVYTGSVSSAAWAEQSSLNPGDKGKLKISIYNENQTYAITLVNVTVDFPWHGFYEGKWIGNETIVKNLPVDIAAKSSWNYSLDFTVPSDARGAVFIGPSGEVVFNVEAEAWKTVVVMNATTGPQYKAEPELTTVSCLIAQGGAWVPQFTTTPRISVSLPTFDPTVNASLFMTQILLIISIVCLVILIVVGFRVSRRLGKQIPPAK